ncbi:hypothetical protein OSB04_028074 [Centaurea solstitialis]|uniref:HAT C-terminal dimerisation domain-containing protein n=1 Tax=Centaurea solstitialis TaxID=347529 RepID=A0AA38SZW9_9ASTR|nr:hypothetical protein OSB04_028074 [Centaurea solstitialis]
MLTLPISTVTTERSFSTMNIVKTRIRNKMEDEFLNDSLLLFIEREVAENKSLEEIVEDFKPNQLMKFCLYFQLSIEGEQKNSQSEWFFIYNTTSLSDAVSAPPLTILSDVTRTPRVASPTGVSRRPARRPTTATITPTVNVGHTVDSAVVQTGTLCEPGVTYPASVVREMIESALKAQIDIVRAEFSCKIAALEAQVKGKGKSTARATTPPPPPSSPQRSTTLASSTEELRDLLMASLLSRGDLIDKEVHLLGSLKQFSDPSLPTNRPEPATAPSHAVGPSTQWLEGKFSDLREEVKSDIGKVKSSLLAIRRALSTSCRAAAEPTKRGHNDREDPGHREGENPKRARRITLALAGKSSGAASVRTSGTHTDTGADDRRRSKPYQSTVAVVEMVRQTSPSLSFGTPPPYMSPLPLTPSPT